MVGAVVVGVQYSTVQYCWMGDTRQVNYYTTTVGVADPTGRAALTARIVIVLKANKCPHPFLPFGMILNFMHVTLLVDLGGVLFWYGMTYRHF